MAQGQRDLTNRGMTVCSRQEATHDTIQDTLAFYHVFMVIFCSNKHFICIANAQAALFILPLSVRSFRLAK